MNRDCMIALDAGSGSGRCAIVDAHGRVLGMAAEDWSPRVPDDEPMGAEFDPEEVWATLCRCAQRALQQASVDPSRVKSISATSQRDGVAFLDDEGHPLHCSTNRDARGVLHAEEITAEFGELIYRTAGRWPLGLDALARLWWFRVHQPQVYQRVAQLCMISDWLIYRLSGQACSEPTNASSSLLFDVVGQRWSAELAEALGFSASIFPNRYRPGQMVAPLTEAAAVDLGLTAGLPVAAGAGDSQAACLGCGAFVEGTTTIIAGTTMPVQMVLSRPVFDEQHRVHLGAYALPQRWVLESNAGLAGVALRWFCESFVGYGPASYEILEAEMRTTEPGGVLAVLGPQVADFRELSFPPKATWVFPFLGAGGELPQRGAFGRSVLENAAFAARGNLEQLVAISQHEACSLNLCGGMSRSRVFGQIVADVCGRPVHVPAVREASVIGTAMCAAVGADLYPDLMAAAEAMVHWEDHIEPITSNERAYRGLYRKWLRLFEQARRL